MALGKIVCYACGGAHKRGEPACRAGPHDVHPDAPQHFKLRQAAKKRKFEEGGGKPKEKDAVQLKKAKPDGGKKHCNQFNFGKGTCRFGAKCRFLHEKKNDADGDKDTGHQLNKKAVAAIVAATIRKTAAHIAKKNKKRKRNWQSESSRRC